jgi:acyl dehydratase
VVNASFTGRTYPPMPPYEVGREKIREFAEVAGEHPFHVDPEAARAAGYPDVIAPPTFAVIIAQRCDAQLVRDPEAGSSTASRASRSIGPSWLETGWSPSCTSTMSARPAATPW